jgi:hypothetical protein
MKKRVCAGVLVVAAVGVCMSLKQNTMDGAQDSTEVENEEKGKKEG